jgi:hypothetical protein
VTPDEARDLLEFHSVIPDPESFLGMLRPYHGLHERAFHEVMACIIALAPELHRKQLDRSVVSALWGICYCGRLWALEPEGMLRRNDLISDKDVKRLTDWIDCISHATMALIDGYGLEVALDQYRQLQRA